MRSVIMALLQITLTRDLDQAQDALEQLEAAGISMDVVTQELEDEGVKAFADAFTQLLATIDERRKSAVSSLGPLADSVSKRLPSSKRIPFPRACGAMIPRYGQLIPQDRLKSKIRLGWLDSPEKARELDPCL